MITVGLVAFSIGSTRGEEQNPTSARSDSPQASRLLAQAQAAVEQGNPERAVAILSSYLQAHPKNIPVRLALGQAYAVAGRSAQAQSEFLTVLQDAAENLTALVSLAEIYLHEGQLDKAELMLRRAAKTRGSTWRLRMQWAVVLVRLHKYEEAHAVISGLTPPGAPQESVEFHRLKAAVASGLDNPSLAAAEMEKALAVQPRNPALELATAVAELQQKNWQRAANLADALYSRTADPQAGIVLMEAQLAMHGDFRQTLERLHATQLNPQEELAVRERLAEILISYGELPAAIEELSRALALAPLRGDLAYNLALAQFKAGRVADALASAEKCRAFADTAELEDLLGDIQEARGDNLGAVRSYQGAVALSPHEESYRLSLALEFIRHNNFDAARLVLKQAEELWPKSWRLQLALGMVEHFAGSDDQAGRILLHAVELAAEPETALKCLGSVQMDQASPPAAAAIAQLCGYSDRHPDDGKLQYYCGALLFRRDLVLGDKTHADEILRRLEVAANLLGNDASPHCQAGKVYRWLERWQEARRDSETCVRMDPNSADGHYRLAQIYQHLGDAERSKQEMTLYQAASERLADENARRDETMKTFLYSIRNQPPDHP